jgi:hypothetical protein
VSRRNRISEEGAYYRLDYNIVLLFGLTELEAVAAWKESMGLLFSVVASFLLTVFPGC